MVYVQRKDGVEYICSLSRIYLYQNSGDMAESRIESCERFEPGVTALVSGSSCP